MLSKNHKTKSFSAEDGKKKGPKNMVKSWGNMKVKG